MDAFERPFKNRNCSLVLSADVNYTFFFLSRRKIKKNACALKPADFEAISSSGLYFVLKHPGPYYASRPGIQGCETVIIATFRETELQVVSFPCAPQNS